MRRPRLAEAAQERRPLTIRGHVAQGAPQVVQGLRLVGICRVGPLPILGLNPRPPDRGPQLLADPTLTAEVHVAGGVLVEAVEPRQRGLRRLQ